MKKIILFLAFAAVSLMNSLSSKAAIETFSTGSYIINMGVVPQTVGNGLKPYGLIYDLIKNHNVPVKWVISQTKIKDGADFTYNSVAYKGGTFIIPAEFRTTAVNTLITTYVGTGMAGTTTTTSLTVDVTHTLNSAPRWTLDAKNGAIAQNFLTNAGIPSTAYNWKLPSALDACDDIFAMPHADPTWAVHGNLYNWVRTQRGSVWAGCHAVSMLENMFNPSATTEQTNFLSTNVGAAGNALVPFGSHSQGSLPYIHQYPNSVAAQFMGTTDGAQEGGSEQIYLPKLSGSWRPSTQVIVYDPTQANVPSLSPGEAAKIVYGRAYGNSTMGWVMYEGGHNIYGTAPANIAAVRAFFNFSFRAADDKAPLLSSSVIPSPINGSPSTTLFSVSATSPLGAALTYQWSSSCGGSFASATSASTVFSPPVVSVSTNCIIKVIISDACGRSTGFSKIIIINPATRSPIAVNDAQSAPCILDSLTKNVLTNDSDPDGDPISFVSFGTSSVPISSPAVTPGGTFVHRGNGNVTFLPNVGFSGTQNITYTITDGTGTANPSAVLAMTIGNPANTPVPVDDSILVGKNYLRLRKNVKTNDTDPLGIGSSIVSIFTNPTKGAASVNLDGTIDYLPNLGVTGTDSFTYRLRNSEGLSATAKVRILITTDGCGAGQIQTAAAVAGKVDSLANLGDTYVSELSVGSNYGLCQNLVVDRDPGDQEASFLKFNTSIIPSGSTITSATFGLNLTSASGAAGGYQVNVHPLTSAFTEGSGTCTGTAASSNWTNYSSPSIGSGSPSFSASISNVSITDALGWFTWTIPTTTIGGWVTTPSSNLGIVVRPDATGGNGERIFASREASTVANRPYLRVVYNAAATCASVPSRPPLANPDFGTTVNGVAVNIPTATNDIYTAGTKEYYIITSPTSGSASINLSSGVISYTPSGTFNGTRTMTYRVLNTTSGLADTATVYINITNAPIDAINDLVLPGDSSNTVQTISVMANDVDPEFAAVSSTNGHTVSIYTAPKNGTATVNGTGQIVYTPNTNFSGKDTLIYQACEPAASCGASNCDTARLFLTILNRRPVPVNDTSNITPCRSVTKSLVANDLDPDGNNLLVTIGSLTVSPSGSVVNNGDGTVTYTPITGFIGTATITYTITDDGVPARTSGTGTYLVNVSNPINTAPVAVDDYADTISMDEISYYNAKDNDYDPDGNPTSNPMIIVSPLHGTATILSNGLVKYIPNLGYFGKDTLTYRIIDTIPLVVATCTFGPDKYDTANIYYVITLPNTVNANNDENSTLINTAVSGLVINNDYDQQGDGILFTGYLNSSGAAVTTGSITVSGYDTAGVFVANAGSLSIGATGGYTYTPTTGFVGVMSVRYTITDNVLNKAYDTATLRISVAPLQKKVNSIIANNDENTSYGNTVTGNLKDNDRDPQGHPFSVTGFKYDTDGNKTPDGTGTLASATTVSGISISGIIWLNAGSLTINSDGTYSFTPAVGFYGDVEAPYTICDIGVPVACQSAVLHIDVLPNANGPLNDPPFAGDDFNFTTVGTPVDGFFINNDTEPNNDSLRFGTTALARGGVKTAIGSPVATNAGGTIQYYTDGSYRYTPPASFVGPDFAYYTVCDITVVSPQPLCSQAMIHLLVDSANVPTPPIANNISAPRMNNSLAATATPSFVASSPIGTPIDSFFVVTVPNPATQGTLYYCSSVTTPCPLASLVAVTAGMKLTAVQSTRLSFDPLASFTGNVSFTYNVKDTNGLLSNTANYVIPVYNNPPVTMAITTAAMPNTNGATAIPSLIGADADGTIASYSIASVPATGGVLSYCTTGVLPGCTATTITGSVSGLTAAQMATLRFDPTAGFVGNFVYTYTATDNNGNVSNASNYTIPVIEPPTGIAGNLPPVANNITSQNINNSLGATAIPNLLGTDPDGTVVKYTIGATVPNPATQGTLSYCVTPPATGCGTAVVAGQDMTPAQAATLSFDPVSSFIGTASFTYTATDNYGTPATSAAATYNIPVVNNPPVANPDRVAPILNTLTTPTPLPALTGSDYDGTVVSYNITSVPVASSGTLKYCIGPAACTAGTLTTISGPLLGLTPAQVATLHFIPNSGFTGDYIFNFTTVDNNSLVSAPAPFTIPVVSSSVRIGEPPVAYSYNAAAINSLSVANLSAALTGTDVDGTVDSFIITSITPANQGILTYCVTPGVGCATSVLPNNKALTPAQAATIVFTPNANFVGTATFTYTDKDNDKNLGNNATVTIPVFNNPPVAQNINNAPMQKVATPTTLNPLASTDGDGTVVSYQILTIPTPSQGTLKVCTTAPSTGCTDVTPNQVLTPAQISQLTFTPNPSGTSPVVSFLYSTLDNSGNTSNMAAANLSLFDPLILPPVANNITSAPINNSSAAVAIPSFQASSPSGTVIDSFFVVTVPNNATEGTLYYCSSVTTPCPVASLVTVTAGMKLTAAQSDRLLFDPLASFVGNVNFTYNVKDANGLLSNTATYAIPVVNTPPVTINIRTTRLIDTTTLIYLPKLVGADADGTVDSFSIFNVPDSASGAKLFYCVSGTLPSCTPTAIPSGAGPTVLTVAQMLTLQVDPTAGFSGDFVFNYTAKDNNKNVSNTSTYTIPIGPLSFSGYGNQPPVATNITSQNINNSLGATPIPNLLGTDPDGTVVKYTITSIPAPAAGVLYYCTAGSAPLCTGGTLTALSASDTLTPAQALTLSFDPVSSFIGTTSFTYTATDNDGTPLTSSAATYNIPVVNQPPVANPDRVAPIANTLTTPTLLPPLSGNDYDGTVVAYNITIVPPASSGTLQYCATGTLPSCTLVDITGPLSSLTAAQVATLNFIPNSGFIGDYVFNFTTTDNNNLTSAAAPFTIPVVPFDVTPGEPPLAYSFNAPALSSTAAATLLTGALTGSDPDGTIASFTITSIPPVAEGVLTYCTTPPATGCGTLVSVGLVLTPAQALTISFDPNADFMGTSTFTYTDLDNDGNLSNTATVTIPIVNNPPVAQNINNSGISRFAGATTLNPLSSTDGDGTVVSYTILSLPSPEDGVLSVCTTAPSTGCTAVTLGQVLTPTQIAQLSFTPNDTVHSPIVTFLYSTKDNSGNISNVAAANIPIVDALALPIELLQFTAKNSGKNNGLIEWKTGQEEVGIQYQLEHSLNGQKWTLINTQAAKNNGFITTTYSYLHTNLAAGSHLYRLSIVDIDNKYRYSPVRTLIVDQSQSYSISVYPNPVYESFTITTSDASMMNEIAIYSNDGKLLQQMNQVVSGAVVSLSVYAPGLYILKIKDKNDEWQMLKLFKK